jgi:hypothetical protein
VPGLDSGLSGIGRVSSIEHMFVAVEITRSCRRVVLTWVEPATSSADGTDRIMTSVAEVGRSGPSGVVPFPPPVGACRPLSRGA